MDTLAKRITDAIDKFYKGFKAQKILKTTEEVEANTNENNLASAVVVGELINDINQLPEFVYDENGRITGYKGKGGADTVFPFSSSKVEIIHVSRPMVEIANAQHGYIVYTVHTSLHPKELTHSSNVAKTVLYERVSSNANVSATKVTYYEFNVTDKNTVSFVLEGGNGTTNEGYALIVIDK